MSQQILGVICIIAALIVIFGTGIIVSKQLRGSEYEWGETPEERDGHTLLPCVEHTSLSTAIPSAGRGFMQARWLTETRNLVTALFAPTNTTRDSSKTEAKKMDNNEVLPVRFEFETSTYERPEDFWLRVMEYAFNEANVDEHGKEFLAMRVVDLALNNCGSDAAALRIVYYFRHRLEFSHGQAPVQRRPEVPTTQMERFRLQEEARARDVEAKYRTAPTSPVSVVPDSE